MISCFSIIKHNLHYQSHIDLPYIRSYRLHSYHTLLQLKEGFTASLLATVVRGMVTGDLSIEKYGAQFYQNNCDILDFNAQNAPIWKPQQKTATGASCIFNHCWDEFIQGTIKYTWIYFFNTEIVHVVEIPPSRKWWLGVNQTISNNI